MLYLIHQTGNYKEQENIEMVNLDCSLYIISLLISEIALDNSLP